MPVIKNQMNRSSDSFHLPPYFDTVEYYFCAGNSGKGSLFTGIYLKIMKISPRFFAVLNFYLSLRP
jgi:hypothetical protein